MNESEDDMRRSAHCSYLFAVRLWPEDLADGQVEWRGHVLHVLSGEGRYFRDWPMLIALLRALLPEADQPPTAGAKRVD